MVIIRDLPWEDSPHLVLASSALLHTSTERQAAQSHRTVCGVSKDHMEFTDVLYDLLSGCQRLNLRSSHEPVDVHTVSGSVS